MISTKDELQYLLHRAWELEKKFESLSSWTSYISIESKYRSTVLILAKESYQHRLNLEKILKKLGLDAPTNEIPETSFDFNGLFYSEILEKTVEYDDIARELYTKIFEKTDPKLVSFLIDGNDTKFFYEQLRKMIEDETRHIGMVRKIVPKIQRIQ